MKFVKSPVPLCSHSKEYDGMLSIVTWSGNIVYESDWHIEFESGLIVITGASWILTITVSVATPQQNPESWLHVL